MKKLVAALFAFLTTLSAYALPVGNPWDASLLNCGVFLRGDCDALCSCWSDALSVRVGFYGDYVFNRHTQVRQGQRHDSIHSTKLFTNAGFAAFNFCDRLDLFATFGTTELQFETRARVLQGAGPNDIVRFETDTRFSWSLGLRGTIWEYGCLALGAEAQYFQARPHLNFIRGEVDNPFYFSGHERLKYKEWQVGLGVSYKVALNPCSTFLVPYAAVKWARVRAHFNYANAVALTDTYNLPNIENERTWGLALGLTLVGCRKASVTVEGRFFDENAVYANTQFRF